MHGSVSRSVTRLDRFALLGRLAQGGASIVLLARAQGWGGFSREFALKVVEADADPILHRRLLDEAYLASRVRHPNVVASIDVGREHGATWLALELVDGIDLRRLTVRRSMPMRAVEAALIVAMVARGAHAVHTATDDHGNPLHAVHRDIAPHNIMLDRDGRAVLIDFGIATADGRTDRVDDETLVGRLPYMSPEQSSMGVVDARSDVFSLGTVLFELITQQLPFGEDDTCSTLERLQACDPAEIAAKLAAHGVPSGIVEVALVCLRRDPAERFASALELAEALEQELVRCGVDTAATQRRLGEIARAACPEGPWVQPLQPRPARRRPTRFTPLRMIAAGVLLAVGLGSAWQLGGGAVLELHDDDDAAALASDAASLRPSQYSVDDEPTPMPTTSRPAPVVNADAAVPMPIVPAAAALSPSTAAVAGDDPPRRDRRRKRSRGLKPNPYAR